MLSRLFSPLLFSSSPSRSLSRSLPAYLSYVRIYYYQQGDPLVQRVVRLYPTLPKTVLGGTQVPGNTHARPRGG